MRFIQLGAGARFDDAGRPVRLSQPVVAVTRLCGITGHLASSAIRRLSRGQLSLPGVWSTSSGAASSLKSPVRITSTLASVRPSWK